MRGIMHRLPIVALAALAAVAADARVTRAAPAALVQQAADSAKPKEKKGGKDGEKKKDDGPKDPGPLFSEDSLINITITVNDMRALLKDRDSTKVKNHAGTVSYIGEDGAKVTIPVQLRTRGAWRRRSGNCEFPPLRFNLAAKDTIKKTLFAKHKVVKMTTHCQRRDDYEQYTIQEYLAYEMYERLTPLSMRARLARVTYIDKAGKSDSLTKLAILLEDDSEIAKRTGTKVMNQMGGTLDDVDQRTLALSSLYEYLVGNTDWAIYNLHNIRLVTDSTGMPYPIPYDWDFSGIVDTRYSIPDPRLPIKTVRDRLYRGNCMSESDWAPIIEKFNANKEAFLEMHRSNQMLDKRRRERSVEYLEDFYKTINDKREFKREIMDACRRGPG